MSRQSALKETGQMEKLLETLKHVDALKYLSVAKALESSDDELLAFDSRMYENDLEDKGELPEIAPQDLHRKLHVFVCDYKKMQESGGIPWYKMHNGKKKCSVEGDRSGRETT
jgi:hypothetical protein